MLSDCTDIRIKRLSARGGWLSVEHRLLFCDASMAKIERVQEFRYRNPFFFLTRYDTFDSFFKTLRAHGVSLRVRSLEAHVPV